MNEAFFTVHRNLPREGPGSPEDVLWALDLARTPVKARILDAACGSGADTVTLAEARPEADILAVEITPHFVEETKQRVAKFGARVVVEERSYLDLTGQFDLIWCAGAVYFHGISEVLAAWTPHLSESGAVAFSEPSWMIEPPSQAARDFWAGEYEPKSLAVIEAEIHAAGWGVIGQHWVVDEPWAAYYGPMSARLDKLEEGGPDADLQEVITEARDEIVKWRAGRDEIAYSLFVVRPV